MHEVAEPSAGALPHLILTTASLPEVSDRGQLTMDWSLVEPAVIKLPNRPLSILLLVKPDVHIPNKMVAQVVTDIHLLNFPVLKI
jgi:hypothetical protein